MSDEFDFTTAAERRGTDSYKWDLRQSNKAGADVLPMWVADMDFPTPRPVIDAIRERAENGVYGYSFLSDSHKDAICRWQSRRNRWDLDPDHLVFAPSVMPAVITAIHTFTQPGDQVLVQPPVYYPFFEAITANGRQIVENPLLCDGGGYTIDLDGLEAAITPQTRMMILCSPHNPVGRVWTRSELEGVASVCLRHNVLMLVDEIHSDLTRVGTEFLPMATLDPEIAAKTLTCIAPTKTFNLAGTATSSVVIPDQKLRDQMETGLHSLGHALPNVMSLAAGEAAYNHGEPWLESLRLFLDDQIAWLSEQLATRLPGVTMSAIEGTYLAWLDFRALLLDRGVSPESLNSHILESSGLWLSDGAVFGTGGQTRQRMNLATSRTVAQDGVSRLVSAVDLLS